ncbi:MAG: hypothetical protein R2697_05095 [Ilumatobacteraceae bacterium]
MLLAAMPATAGCGECEADCAGPEVVVGVDNRQVASVELCQGTDCDVRTVSATGESTLTFAVVPAIDDHVTVDVTARDLAGNVLVTDTFVARLPKGECGCEYGPLFLRVDSSGIESA